METMGETIVRLAEKMGDNMLNIRFSDKAQRALFLAWYFSLDKERKAIASEMIDLLHKATRKSMQDCANLTRYLLEEAPMVGEQWE